MGGSSKAIKECIGIAQRTVFTKSNLPLFGSVVPFHVSSLLASCSTRYWNCGAVNLRILRGRPKYLHGKVPIEHPQDALRPGLTWSWEHLIGMAELFSRLTRKPEAMPKSSRILAQVRNSVSLVLMNSMTSSVNMDMCWRGPRRARGVSKP